jgi:hypothetical protein
MLFILKQFADHDDVPLSLLSYVPGVAHLDCEIVMAELIANRGL